jgi:WD40 repeat protein
VNAGRTLASLLAEQPALNAPQAVRILRQLAAQVASRHDLGLLHRGITIAGVIFDDAGAAEFAASPAVSETALDEAELQSLLPELSRLASRELPEEIAVARASFSAVGIMLDPRQVDLCQLGAVWCRLLTGESAQAYLRSPRTKGKVPAELRPVLERALGYNGRQRFADARELIAALDAVVRPKDEGVDAEEPTPAGACPASDTTPSFVASANAPADTSIGLSPSSPQVVAKANRRDSQTPLPFTRLAHYEIVARIGHGGMGDVYRGYESALDRPVAIKVLPAELARQEDFVRRFRAEAMAAARLTHPNIVPIYFIGDDCGTLFFSMQMVEGESLAQRLAHSGNVPWREAVSFIEQILKGLAAAHESGLVHRDIKPGNLLWDQKQSRALLADFGLAKAVQASMNMTATGTILGTVDYIAPEQARGLAVDQRSDLYSIGCVLFHMLAGRLPFQGDSPTALIFQHVYEPPPDLRSLVHDLPEHLCAVVMRLMSKEPRDRHPTAAVLLDDLRALHEHAAAGATTDRRAEAIPATTLTPAIIRAAEVSPFDEPETALPSPGPRNGWQRLREAIGDRFKRRRPEWLAALQNTQQQVDGVVARHEVRQQNLRKLEKEAEQICTALLAQERDYLLASSEVREKGSGEQAVSTGSVNADDARQHAATIRSLLAQQQDELGEIRLQLAKVSATLAQLRTQRDLLNARLRVARVGVPSLPGRNRRAQFWMGTSGVVVMLGILGAWCLSNQKDGGSGDQQIPFEQTVGRNSPASALPSSNAPSELPPDVTSNSTPDSPVNRPPTRPRIVQHSRASPAATASPALPEDIPRQTFKGPQLSVRSLAFSPDGTQVYAVSDNIKRPYRYENCVWIWNAETGVRDQALSLPHAISWGVFSPDVKHVLVLQHKLYFYALDDLSTASEFPAKSGAIHMALSADGRYVGAQNEDSVQVWELGTGREVCTYESPGLRLCAMALAPDGSRIALGTNNGLMLIVNGETGQEIARFGRMHSTSIHQIKWFPEGHFIVSRSNTGEARIWNALSGVTLRQFDADASQSDTLAVLPDGRHVLAILPDKYRGGPESGPRTLALINVETGDLDRSFRHPEKSVLITTVAASPDGKRALTADLSNVIRLWDLVDEPNEHHE